MSVSDDFAKRLNKFMRENPDWKENSSYIYAGMGEYIIEISIDINTHSKGKRYADKEHQNLIGDKIDDAIRNL